MSGERNIYPDEENIKAWLLLQREWTTDVKNKRESFLTFYEFYNDSRIVWSESGGTYIAER